MEPSIRGTTAELLRFECDLILQQLYIHPFHFINQYRLIIRHFVLYSPRLRLLGGTVWETFARHGVTGLYKKNSQ